MPHLPTAPPPTHPSPAQTLGLSKRHRSVTPARPARMNTAPHGAYMETIPSDAIAEVEEEGEKEAGSGGKLSPSGSEGIDIV